MRLLAAQTTRRRSAARQSREWRGVLWVAVDGDADPWLAGGSGLGADI